MQRIMKKNIIILMTDNQLDNLWCITASFIDFCNFRDLYKDNCKRTRRGKKHVMQSTLFFWKWTSSRGIIYINGTRAWFLPTYAYGARVVPFFVGTTKTSVAVKEKEKQEKKIKKENGSSRREKKRKRNGAGGGYDQNETRGRERKGERDRDIPASNAAKLAALLECHGVWCG